MSCVCVQSESVFEIVARTPIDVEDGHAVALMVAKRRRDHLAWWCKSTKVMMLRKILLRVQDVDRYSPRRTRCTSAQREQRRIASYCCHSTNVKSSSFTVSHNFRFIYVFSIIWATDNLPPASTSHCEVANRHFSLYCAEAIAIIATFKYKCNSFAKWLQTNAE